MVILVDKCQEMPNPEYRPFGHALHFGRMGQTWRILVKKGAKNGTNKEHGRLPWVILNRFGEELNLIGLKMSEIEHFPQRKPAWLRSLRARPTRDGPTLVR